MTNESGGNIAALAHLLVKARRLDEALKNIDRAITLEPDEAGHHRLRASVLEQLERLEEAELAVKRALELSPGDLDLTGDLNRIGDAYLASLRSARNMSSSVEQAISIVEKIVRRAPGSAGDVANLAHLLVKARRLDESLKNIDRAITIEPDEAEHHRLRASVLEQLERLEEAEWAAKQALELSPGDLDLTGDLNRIGNAYLARLRNACNMSSSVEQTISIMDEIVRRIPDSSGDAATLAHLLVKARRLDEALKNIDRALSLEPDESGHHRLRASVLEQLMRFEEAAQSAKRAFQLMPENRELLLDIKRIRGQRFLKIFKVNTVVVQLKKWTTPK